MILDFSWNFLHMCTRLDVIYASHYYLKVWTPICLKLHLEFRSSNDWNNFVRYYIVHIEFDQNWIIVITFCVYLCYEEKFVQMTLLAIYCSKPTAMFKIELLRIVTCAPNQTGPCALGFGCEE